MKTWTFAQNTFDNATQSSYPMAMDISTYHDGALDAAKNESFFLGLYNSFHPLHIDYTTAYNTWLSHGDVQQGGTLNLQQLLQLLSNTKIKQWDIKIQNQYPQNTPDYKRLLPNRRAPFQHGRQSDRLSQVKALSTTIGTDVTLAAVKTDVDSFRGLLESAITAQKGSFSITKTMSGDIELAREAMCTGMFANLGAIIQKFAATPDRIGEYFDLQTMRRAQQVLFTGHIKAGEARTIVKHTFGESDEVWLSNPGQAQLKFYLAPSKDMKPDGTAFSLVKGEETLLASALGKLTSTFLTVYNADPLQTGEFSIELV